MMQASSDMSIVDFDIPFAISYTLVVIIEIPIIITIMIVVTWQVLIVVIPIMITIIYFQVKPF